MIRPQSWPWSVSDSPAVTSLRPTQHHLQASSHPATAIGSALHLCCEETAVCTLHAVSHPGMTPPTGLPRGGEGALWRTKWMQGRRSKPLTAERKPHFPCHLLVPLTLLVSRRRLLAEPVQEERGGGGGRAMEGRLDGRQQLLQARGGGGGRGGWREGGEHLRDKEGGVRGGGAAGKGEASAGRARGKGDAERQERRGMGQCSV